MKQGPPPLRWLRFRRYLGEIDGGGGATVGAKNSRTNEINERRERNEQTRIEARRDESRRGWVARVICEPGTTSHSDSRPPLSLSLSGRIVARCRVGVASPNPWLWALPIFLLLSALFASRARSPSMENDGTRSRNLDSFNFPRGTRRSSAQYSHYASSVWLKARLSNTWPLRGRALKRWCLYTFRDVSGVLSTVVQNNVSFRLVVIVVCSEKCCKEGRMIDWHIFCES